MTGLRIKIKGNYLQKYKKCVCIQVRESCVCVYVRMGVRVSMRFELNNCFSYLVLSCGTLDEEEVEAAAATTVAVVLDVSPFVSS